MRRVRIQKRPRARASAQLSGGWKPVEQLTAKALTLSKAERLELEQRTRMELIIREHAVA